MSTLKRGRKRRDRAGKAGSLVPWLVGGLIAFVVLLVGGAVAIVALTRPADENQGANPNAGGPLQVTNPDGHRPGTPVTLSPQAANNFGQLRRGMSEQQVVALLGLATTRTAAPALQMNGASFPSSVSLIYGKFGLTDHILVEIRDDKLQHANGRLNGQPLHLGQ